MQFLLEFVGLREIGYGEIPFFLFVRNGRRRMVLINPMASFDSNQYKKTHNSTRKTFFSHSFLSSPKKQQFSDALPIRSSDGIFL